MMTDDQKDVLSELINIAFGSATATIADLFDNFATLRVPSVDVIRIEQINNVIQGLAKADTFYLTTQQIRGDFHGEIVHVFREESAKNMQAVLHDEFTLEDDEISIEQNILEISNILGSSCLGKFAEMLDAVISFSPPLVEQTNLVVQNVEDSPYSYVITISTVLEFRELDIQGNIFIMFGDDMYTQLEQALDHYLENI